MEEGDSVVDAWNSFATEDRKLNRNVMVASAGPATASAAVAGLPPVDMRTGINATQDAAWAATNAATARLATTPAAQQVLAANNKLDLEERALVKQRRPANGKKERQAAARTATQEEIERQAAATSILSVATAAASPPPIVVPAPAVAPAIPIETLEQHQRRDKETELFAYTIERTAQRASTDVIASTPPVVSTLQYCATLAGPGGGGGVAWYNAYLKGLGGGASSFQNVPLITRSVLVTFLREPDQGNAASPPYERPCFNLDREPLPHEQRVRCIAHRLSEELLGPGKGYRLRELLYNDQCVKINAAMARGSDPMVHLTPVPELCFMCHVWMTTEACLDQRNKLEERKRKDLTSTTTEPMAAPLAIIFNRFMVDIDKPGEYDRRKMLCSDDVAAMGVWGPFPMWNRRHYVACMVRFPTGRPLRGFEETDDLLFRLPRVPLLANGSIQSTPTSAAPAASLTFQSRRRLIETVFVVSETNGPSGSVGFTAPIFNALLNRHALSGGADADPVDYITRIVIPDICRGEITSLTLDTMRDMIMDGASQTVRHFLTKSFAEVKREQGTPAAMAAESHRVLTEEERLNRIMELARSGAFNTATPSAPATPSSSALAEDDAAEEDDSIDVDAFSVVTRENCWSPYGDDDAAMPPMDNGYTWFYTVYFRLIGAQKLCAAAASATGVTAIKVERFKNAHLALVQYFDDRIARGLPVDDASIDTQHLVTLYRPLGESHYECDAQYVRVTRREHVLKRTPLEIIEEQWPEHRFRPEERDNGRETAVAVSPWLHDEWCPISPPPSVETHQLYYGIIRVLNLCRELIDNDDNAERCNSCHSLWLYYVSFTDLFEYCLSRSPVSFDDRFLLTPIDSQLSRDGKTLIRSDKVSPWQLYGPCGGTRAFCAGDLPDLYHVLMAIPLWGEQNTPPYVLGKIYQKALPFACQRRHLIKLVIGAMRKEEAFAHMVRRLAWVMLAGLYPNGPAGASANASVGSMRHLLRVKELTSDTERLIAALAPPSSTERANSTGGGPLVILTMFRMHILYMVDGQQYEQQARRCLDWDHFKRDTIKLAAIVCGYPLFPADPFAQARKELTKTVKSPPHSKVQRLRRKSVALSLTDQFNETLEKTVLKDKQNFALDLEKISANGAAVADTYVGAALMAGGAGNGAGGAGNVNVAELCQSAADFYERLFTRAATYKSAILNALICVPTAADRLTRATLTSILTRPECGGVTCVPVLCELINLFRGGRAAPKELRHRIGQLSLHDFLVCCFYFNMVSLLERISFVPLDAETVRRTDAAMMTRKHALYPGQRVGDDLYDVSISLCCEKICTLMGTGRGGNKKVAYDIERDTFVCGGGGVGAVKRKKRAAAEAAEAEIAAAEDEDADSIESAESAESADEEDRVAAVLDAEQEDYEGDGTDLISVAASIAHGGKSKARASAMHHRKAVRNERKAFSRIPCSARQPVLTFSLRGRALVWGNTLESRKQIMFCPQCAALHVYTLLNFSQSESGLYRCNECARKELMHTAYHACVYCGKAGNGSAVSGGHCLEVMDPALGGSDEPERALQLMYFCKTHYRIARRYPGVVKEDLWRVIRRVQEQRALQYAKGIYHK